MTYAKYFHMARRPAGSSLACPELLAEVCLQMFVPYPSEASSRSLTVDARRWREYYHQIRSLPGHQGREALESVQLRGNLQQSDRFQRRWQLDVLLQADEVDRESIDIRV